MINDPFPVCLTFDLDAEAGVVGRDAANAERPVARSAGHPLTLYNRACMYSLWEKPDEALEDLRRAIEGDAEIRELASADSDYANILGDPRFQELIGEAEPPGTDTEEDDSNDN